MGNPWKWTALGLIAVMGIVATSSLTTAYFMRPPAAAPTATAINAEPAVEHRVAVASVVAPKPIARTARAVRPIVTRVATAPAPVATSNEAPPAMPVPAVVSAPASAPAPVASPPTPVPAAPAPTTPVAAPSMPTASARPADCGSSGDRALRVAKPGVLGALLGAGLGAAGGAIANGGKGAGKGALIGGIAGGALGTGYGAYKTKNECGTILGGDHPASAMSAPNPGGAASSVAGQGARNEVAAPLQSPESVERIQVYGVR